MKRWFPWVLVLTVLVPVAVPARGGEKKGDAAKELAAVVDPQGKEIKVRNWKFTGGTKQLSWLTADKDKDLDCLEFYEGKGAPMKTSVLTYLPLQSIRSIVVDPTKDRETMTVRVARSDKEADDVVLVGPIFYQGFNTFSFSATVEADGKAGATEEFSGGNRDGIRAIRFPAPRPVAPMPKGRVAAIKPTNEKHPTLEVVDLQVVYERGGQMATRSMLYFNDTSSMDLDKIAKVTQMRSGGNNYQVFLPSGQKSYRVLVGTPKTGDDGGLELFGFAGRFAAGYRLFPLVRVGEVLFEDAKK